jgi:uncharacterized protein
MIPLALHELVLAGVIFVLAGTVKGIAGFGFPAVSLGLLALFRPLPEGMALILAPTLLTNIWQAFAGPHLKPLLRRLWGLFLGSTLGAAVGAAMIAEVDTALLAVLLGVLLIIGALYALFGRPFPSPSPVTERWLSPLVGLVSGVITGLTGSYLMPAAPYLVALRLRPGEFVQAFGLGVIGALAALGVGLRGAGLLPADLGLVSLLGVAPSFLGMWIGQRLRGVMPEARFRQLIQVILGLLGVSLLIKGLR